MTSYSSAANHKWKRWLAALVVFLLVAYVIRLLTSPEFGALREALTPPVMPEPLNYSAQVAAAGQNWSAVEAEEFHFKSQGTRTLPIPFSWFEALERPAPSFWTFPIRTMERFANDDYLLRFGFIHADKSAHNPHSLPMGLVTTPNQPIAGLQGKWTAIGFTCAACHTGQLLYGDKQYIIEGGPADTDLGQLTLALAAALGQTALSAKLRPLDGRFERFAHAVLGDRYSDLTRNQLLAQLNSVVGYLAERPNGVAVTEGFSRLDALNRIGNQVFAWGPHRYGNYVNVDAPVNFPHIWTASWFNWVQYDGSIMQPLVRNAGEAMGVAAHVDYTSPGGQGRLSNAAPLANLHWIESLLAGPDEPAKAKQFSGLRAPIWPDAFPPVDQAKATRGAELYRQYCKGCHLPALTREVANGSAPQDEFWQHFWPVTWDANGEQKQTPESLLGVHVIPQAEMGTDPAQSQVLATRSVDTAGMATTDSHGPGIGIDSDVCLNVSNDPRSPRLVTVHISDDSRLNFGAGLGAIVQQGINAWFAQNPDANRAEIEGDRPNCLQVGKGYKARPLNGVWATAPFLHNGSVPTLMALLGPADERPARFLLGDAHFDPKDVGIKVVVPPADAKGDYTREGYFILDTHKAGNHNTGHEFSDDKHPGVVGPALSHEEREDIIEFLKTL